MPLSPHLGQVPYSVDVNQPDVAHFSAFSTSFYTFLDKVMQLFTFPVDQHCVLQVIKPQPEKQQWQNPLRQPLPQEEQEEQGTFFTILLTA
ncbi:MAG: hypothetical protein U9R29_00720 [Thermodesulfobacteriota bacterium]|nr:hypothetical protein [Thermodesulfobacteriota bacterium]